MLPEIVSKGCQSTQFLCRGLLLPGALQLGTLAAMDGRGGGINSTSFLLLPPRTVQVALSFTFTKRVVRSH